MNLSTCLSKIYQWNDMKFNHNEFWFLNEEYWTWWYWTLDWQNSMLQFCGLLGKPTIILGINQLIVWSMKQVLGNSENIHNNLEKNIQFTIM